MKLFVRGSIPGVCDFDDAQKLPRYVAVPERLLETCAAVMENPHLDGPIELQQKRRVQPLVAALP